MYASSNIKLQKKAQANAEEHKAKERKHEEHKDTVEVMDVDPNSEMETCVLSIVNALTLKDIEVLLSIVWSTKGGRLEYILFQTFLGLTLRMETTMKSPSPSSH